MSETIILDADLSDDDVHAFLADLRDDRGEDGYELVRTDRAGEGQQAVVVEWASESPTTFYIMLRAAATDRDVETMTTALESAGFDLRETDSGAFSVHRDYDAFRSHNDGEPPWPESGGD